MSAKKNVKRTVTGQALKVLDIEALQTDPSYQREVKKKHRDIVADFDKDALGIPVVGEREDGTFWIVDGLQRITALRKLGKREVRVEVFPSRGPEHEAQVFKKINMNRTGLNWGERYKALLASHDELAWKIKSVVEECGYQIVSQRSGADKKEPSGRQLTCIGAMFGIAKNHGTDPIKFALSVANDVWPGDTMGVYNTMVEGLSIFFVRNDRLVDLDRLIPRLRTVTAQKVLYAANQASLASSSKGESVADQIQKVYQKRMGRKRGGSVV